MKVCSSMKQMMLHLLRVRWYFHVEGVPHLRYVFISCLHHLGRWWWVETRYLLKFITVHIPLCWNFCLIIIFFWKLLFNIFHARVSIKNGKFPPLLFSFCPSTLWNSVTVLHLGINIKCIMYEINVNYENWNSCHAFKRLLSFQWLHVCLIQ